MSLAGLVEFGRWLSLMDLIGSGLCSCVFRLDSYDLRIFSSVAVVVLVRWSHGAKSISNRRAKQAPRRKFSQFSARATRRVAPAGAQ